MIRVVVDTNVLVSAALKHGGNEDRVVGAILTGRLALYVADEIVAEYRSVLGRAKFAFAAARVDRLLAGLMRCATCIVAATGTAHSPDPGDTAFIA